MPLPAPRRRSSVWIGLAGLIVAPAAGLLAALAALLIGALGPGGQCASPAGPGQVVLAAPGSGQVVGASEYGGPGDPSSGTIGASGVNLLEHPDSYAELGGQSFQSATAMGGLPYMTPLRVAWEGRSAVAYKRDFGFGGGPVDGLPRVIDLWWEFAGALGIPYEHGLWSGPVRITRPPDSGAANVLGQADASALISTPSPVVYPGVSTPSPVVYPGVSSPIPAADPTACGPNAPTGVPLIAGERAKLLPDGLAAAPSGAPPAIKEMIAAGNEIAGKPYLYGAGHGLPLSEVAPAYDCSSSVEHLLFGARLLPVDFAAPSGVLEGFGAPGPGAWVTLYANPDHVFMYVAGLRWDTHDAAGAGDGSAGIGWHPLIRSAAGFVARHPVGL